ncbi:MAG TPA: transposase [Bacteroidota bacterium]|nr:transposase [Bacteroidota bacterium]
MKYTEGHYYHAYNRGAHKKKIFLERDNYLYLITLLAKYSARYGVAVVAYCLMPNHYHLVLKQSDSGFIGMFLKTTFNAYTQAINKRFAKSGTLFQGQVNVKELDSDSYCLQAIRYIHLNPCSARIVDKPEDWLFSDYCEWIGIIGKSWTNLSLRDGYFKSPRDYKKFVDEYMAAKELNELKKFLEQ